MRALAAIACLVLCSCAGNGVRFSAVYMDPEHPEITLGLHTAK